MGSGGPSTLGHAYMFSKRLDTGYFVAIPVLIPYILSWDRESPIFYPVNVSQQRDVTLHALSTAT